MEELINQVSVCAMDFDAIETCFMNGGGGSLSVKLNVLPDFLDGERTRSRTTLQRNIRSRDVVEFFLGHCVRLSGPTESPKLKVDEGTLCMNPVCDLRCKLIAEVGTTPRYIHFSRQICDHRTKYQAHASNPRRDARSALLR